jgi:hypothetical protein
MNPVASNIYVAVTENEISLICGQYGASMTTLVANGHVLHYTPSTLLSFLAT